MWRQMGWTAALFGMSAGIFVSAVFWGPVAANDTSPGEYIQIDQFVAPVALYPDRLLAKVLIASTYPLEVTEAANWLEQNRRSPERAMRGNLQNQRWDGSIKDLVRVPRLIVMMNDHLDWTQTLGDMFLSRTGAVIDAVQALRARAIGSGFLRSNNFQTVVNGTAGIEIRPVSTDRLYLPYYDPQALYASKPHKPPQPSWVPPPGHWYDGKIAFLPGVIVPSTVWDASLTWDERRVYVTRSAEPGNEEFSRPPAERVFWQHDPAHRRGVNYSTPELRARYGRQSAADANARRAFRGFAGTTQQGRASANSKQHDGLGGTSYNFGKHGGALDGVEEGVEMEVFSRRGHKSLRAGITSDDPRPRDMLRP